MDADRWRQRMERYERTLAAFVLAGSLTAGVLPPSEDHLADAGTLTAAAPREYDGLHTHPEIRLITLDVTSPVIITGAGLPGRP